MSMITEVIAMWQSPSSSNGHPMPLYTIKQWRTDDVSQAVISYIAFEQTSVLLSPITHS